MKKILLLCCSVITFLSMSSQIKPITWAATYKPISASEGEVIVIGTIAKGWHTYSMRPNDAVPVPTTFSFKESKDYQMVGSTQESNEREAFDAALGVKLYVFVERAEFKQKIKLNSKGRQTISFIIEYIMCDDKMCMPPTTIDLSVKTK